ncbi:anti-sigma factor [Methylonatrum kenyense]|uniref:anti-sigma factor n=1 Tax=Methylonatrum kenyense TaxID=455253 RepID=UPI0020BE68ED|nr:anti-sigma factor [Methylonatrum kenyense]MCK8516555.1 anti-sigma factor [Methylonatrum kenyense]
MNDRTQKLDDELAAAYVLGTMTGRTRLRFERRMQREQELRERVLGWQRHFDALHALLPERRPTERVWLGILARINMAGRSEAEVGIREKLGASIRVWRTLALAGAVGVAALLVFQPMMMPPDPPPAPVEVPSADYLAVLSGEGGRQHWMLAAQEAEQRLRITAVEPLETLPDQDYELWLLPPEEDPVPRSMGLLPRVGDRTISLAEEDLQDLRQAGAFAVSIEPEGGSPTGAPTGEVVLVAPVLPF